MGHEGLGRGRLGDAPWSEMLQQTRGRAALDGTGPLGPDCAQGDLAQAGEQTSAASTSPWGLAETRAVASPGACPLLVLPPPAVRWIAKVADFQRYLRS